MLIEIKMGNRPKFENLSMADLYWFHSLGPLSNLTNDESVIEVMDILSSITPHIKITINWILSDIKKSESFLQKTKNFPGRARERAVIKQSCKRTTPNRCLTSVCSVSIIV